MGAEKLGKDHRLRRERREEDTPLGSNTRQHKTSAETAGGLWPLADVGAGQGPGKVALRSSQSSNYREGWGSPPWLPTRQEESKSQLSPRAPNATRQPDSNLVFRGVTPEFSVLSGQ